jgi:hypothetical protein
VPTTLQSEPTPPDLLAVIRKVTVKEVEDRLDALDEEKTALRALLATLRARERAAKRNREAPRGSID